MTIIQMITLFATLTASTSQPSDLCDIVYPDTGRPMFCEPHRDGAPKYDDVVCCNDKSCSPSTRGSCSSGLVAYYCSLGELQADGVVSCYFEVPDYCQVFPCKPGYNTWPQANYMCCYEGICWNTYHTSNDCEIDDIYWCDDGVTNQDGTVTCFD